MTMWDRAHFLGRRYSPYLSVWFRLPRTAAKTDLCGGRATGHILPKVSTLADIHSHSRDGAIRGICAPELAISGQSAQGILLEIGYPGVDMRQMAGCVIDQGIRGNTAEQAEPIGEI